jgi:osmotically-inducible protein OsmY
MFGLMLGAQAPDNTEKNKRDRGGQTITPEDQSNNPADRDMLRKIRQAIMADKSLSTYGHNVKIMVEGGKVTLRGPVNSAEEKQKVEMLAKQAAGVTSVQNNLEVTAPKGDK